MNPQNEILETRAAASKHSDPEPWPDGIAIIGMSARFPQSRNIGEFWQHLVHGDSLIAAFSDEELRRSGMDEALLADPAYVRRGNRIEDADCFDAEFFGLSRREAEILDPQHRVFLECAWEALENAGRTGEGERVGVFAGAGMNTYVLQLLANPGVLAAAGNYQLMLASDKDYLATRAAYKLNLRGPAVTVQTACSTSLAAVHLACRSLLNRECSMALAGGVSISFPQGVGYTYIPGMILSPDGTCRPFDADAAGTVPGRGAGIVVLKRLSEAVADGDSIVAVIRGSAWNNDGAAKVGYTAPSVDGQAEVIRAALATAAVDAARVGYIETHGTATALGDAIECAALAQVFGPAERTSPLILGAVKANMGHADAAAGIAGLIKGAIAVQSGLIPPTPNFTQPNPALSLDHSPFVISASAVDWSGEQDRWAGVSSFGIGGTNVHLVLSAAPAVPPRETEPARPHVFPVSARTPSALSAACGQLSQWLASEAPHSPADAAATLQMGRRALPFRRAVVAESCAEAASLLLQPDKRSKPGADLSRDVVFLFPGQGQQFPGMCEALYRRHSAFRRTIDEGCAILKGHAAPNLLPFLAGSDRTPELSALLRNTEIAQPLLFLVEYALAQLWRSLGVEPAALLGHSLGELTAACVAGVFSFHDGLRLSAERGRLMAETAPGLMLAVMLAPERLAPFLDTGLWLAAENGPKMSVVSGSVDAVERLEKRLAAEGVAAVRLASKNAFHTPMMADAARAFEQIVAAVPRHAPRIPWLSNVTGTWIAPAEAQDPQYWARQILSPVRFTHNLAVLSGRRRLLLEVGPGDALLGIGRRQMPTSLMAPSLGAENRRHSDAAVFRQALSIAWESGVSIHWEQLDPGVKTRRVPLPTYPFERQRYWVEPATATAQAAAPVAPPPPSPQADYLSSVKRDDLSAWFYAPSWQSTPPAAIALPPHSRQPECWLLLAGGDQLSSALTAALRSHGNTVVHVQAAEQFTWHDGDATLNPASTADMESLWQRMDDTGIHPGALLCVAGPGPGPGSGSDAISSYDAILRLLQTAGPRRRHLRRFECVTSALESVHGEPVTNPAAGELHGLAAAIAAEFEGIACRCIDMDLPNGNSHDQAQQLLDELAANGAGLSVAYRQGIRWQKRWTPAPLQPSSQSPFRQGGVYLITGGAGGIGYKLAMHLLQQHAARVAVTSRSPLPGRTEWEAWIAGHDKADSTSRRIRRMQEMESAGGEILFLAADVADKDAMREAIERTQQRFGPLNGVIHAAGLQGGSRIPSQSLDEALQIRRPKIEGSRVLADLLRGSSIDFLLFCSSISAFAPPPSQSAYAAANAFQNSFAAFCRSVLHIPAVAIGFDAWRDVGMLADLAVPEGMESWFEANMRHAMTSGEGIEVVRRVLGQWRGPQILTSTVDLDELSKLRFPRPAAAQQLQSDETPAAQSAELAAILDIWQDLLGADSIHPSDNFFSLGGHSLMATMMIARIRERLGVSLSLRHVFEAQTPAALAEMVRSANGQRPADHAAETFEDEEREVFEI